MTKQYLTGAQLSACTHGAGARHVRAQLPPKICAVNRKVKPVESAAYHYEAQAADGGSNELRAQACSPHGAVGQEEADETSHVAAPATGEDGGGGAQGGGVHHVHFLTVVGGGHRRGLGP